MRLLIVGGTGFLGGACARVAVGAGHDVTVLTRTGRNVAKGAGALVADRMALPDLRGRFDAVIDTCAYHPRMVEALAASVGTVGAYVMVSSISAYAVLDRPGLDEEATLLVPSAADLALGSDPGSAANAASYGAAYGPLKRGCEDAAVGWCQQAALIRLGLIVGPGDYTDRFTWWVRRIDQGGTVLVPGPADRQVQIIDVADAAVFIVRLAAGGGGGAFNVTGRPIPLRAMLAEMTKVTASGADFDLRPLEQFIKAGLCPWTDLPLVLPDDPDVAGMLAVSTAKAEAAGLVTRPLPDTIRAVLDWDRSRRDTPLRAGMTAAQENEVRSAPPK